MYGKNQKQWKKKLSQESFAVCRLGATEPAFSGKFLDNHQKGSYHCIACGVKLFSSETKYDSGSGWPSFWDYAERENIKTRKDNSLGMQRTEVLCANCGSHLGHVFEDGPKPTGLRYCINSVSLDFVPEKM